MSAAEALKAALIAALDGHQPFAGTLNGVHAIAPVRATPPFAVVGEMTARDWSTKTEAGRELRFAVSVFEEPERAERLAALTGAAETAIEAMARDLDGWRLASLVFVRSRVVRGQGPWAGVMEYRARVLGV